MKKTYLNPSLELIRVDPADLLTASRPVKIEGSGNAPSDIFADIIK
ncbi:MAG: hypothetical protein J5885_03185 [Clostridia bacterium]|nr:hypothetical protein [Clostridia bacterium]